MCLIFVLHAPINFLSFLFFFLSFFLSLLMALAYNKVGTPPLPKRPFLFSPYQKRFVLWTNLVVPFFHFFQFFFLFFFFYCFFHFPLNTKKKSLFSHFYPKNSYSFFFSFFHFFSLFSLIFHSSLTFITQYYLPKHDSLFQYLSPNENEYEIIVNT